MILLLLAVQSLSCMAQTPTDVNKFLNEFKDFVNKMTLVENPTEKQKEAWKAQFSDIKETYSTKYKPVMTDEQVETYFGYCGQYRKKMGKENLKEAGEWMDSTSVVVGKSIQRGAKKVSGAVKGFLKKDKKGKKE